MDAQAERVREDFDRIALLTERHGGAHGAYAYHRYLLRRLPARCGRALEVGCGSGEFTRLLAARAGSVLAVDLSPEMIRLATQASSARANVEYVLGDFMRLPLPPEEFDCAVSLATLHHLPLDEALPRLTAALRPGGVLVIHDLIADDGLADTLLNVPAYAAAGARRLWRTGCLRAPAEVRRAWAEHGAGETYLTPDGVREMCRRHLPGAHFRRHLLWRYTVTWHKPAAASAA